MIPQNWININENVPICYNFSFTCFYQEFSRHFSFFSQPTAKSILLYDFFVAQVPFFILIYDLWPPPYCWHCSFMLTVYILSPGGTHPCPSQSTSFWTTSCCTTNRLLTSCSVCVCDLLIYVLSWPSYHGDRCMVTGGHTICFVKYTYYIISCDKLLQDFFFLNDSWIRNNKWSWLLYSLCWLFFYMTEASMVFCV